VIEDKLYDFGKIEDVDTGGWKRETVDIMCGYVETNTSKQDQSLLRNKMDTQALSEER
jgi:hypothetical protein